jgi:hypothetical protein
MIPVSDFERHTAIRARIKAVINHLKSVGVTAAELIEACRRELQLLHIEDCRHSKTNAEVLTRPGAGSSLSARRKRK